jgi:hypothetical protein
LALPGHQACGKNGAVSHRPDRFPTGKAGFGRILRATSEIAYAQV